MIDDTKTYRLMCQKANLPWEPKVGNRTNRGIIFEISKAERKEYNTVFFVGRTHKSAWWCTKDNLFPHFSIEQLLEMIEDTEDRKLSQLERWTDETYIDHWKPWGIFRTLREVILAFVMHKLHGKRWNEEDDWV